MIVKLQRSEIHHKNELTITGSKSESNRLLILQALYPEIKIKNLSNSDDTQLLKKALSTSSAIIDIHHAGTAMRFLTAYFATHQGKEVILTGSDRMQERPLKVLVDALKELGADVSYENNEGFPPLKIKGKNISKNRIALSANVSSQYISALLLAAPKLQYGLELILEGKITSMPYIKMTLSLLNSIGVQTQFEDHRIIVKHLPDLKESQLITVESDWSSASYFYSMIALSALGTEITLSYYKKESLQGDAILAKIYRDFGVETSYHEHAIILKKDTEDIQRSFNYELNNAPDIAQTIAVTCLGLGSSCHLTGLHTLKIKETDRLVAMKTEIEKFGAKVEVSKDTFKLESCSTLINNISVETYHDHRMAMAFGPLAQKISLQINEADVVSKSYPNYWDDLSKLGISLTYS